mmetsp:Transcript_3092/g.12433  ORF Transcript_3092/g.12433 Transcript_3092/m.12433 type:complete len:299 (-) Transcript_3092:1316-2212(-)
MLVSSSRSDLEMSVFCHLSMPSLTFFLLSTTPRAKSSGERRPLKLRKLNLGLAARRWRSRRSCLRRSASASSSGMVSRSSSSCCARYWASSSLSICLTSSCEASWSSMSSALSSASLSALRFLLRSAESSSFCTWICFSIWTTRSRPARILDVSSGTPLALASLMASTSGWMSPGEMPPGDCALSSMVRMAAITPPWAFSSIVSLSRSSCAAVICGPVRPSAMVDSRASLSFCRSRSSEPLRSASMVSATERSRSMMTRASSTPSPSISRRSASSSSWRIVSKSLAATASDRPSLMRL